MKEKMTDKHSYAIKMLLFFITSCGKALSLLRQFKSDCIEEIPLCPASIHLHLSLLLVFLSLRLESQPGNILIIKKVYLLLEKMEKRVI